MKKVRAKKSLGQHFLINEQVAMDIVASLESKGNVLEVGAGMGVLSKYLSKKNLGNFRIVEIDRESVVYLRNCYPELEGKIIEGDFLKADLHALFHNEDFSLIGNFPYNISNLILFKVFENKDIVKEVVGMFQKEVAQRTAAREGSKTYGILSVLLSVFYDREYLFEVPNTDFDPMPEVQSAVIRLKRNNVTDLGVEEKLFINVVKTAFNQRRKMLRQALKPLGKSLENLPEEILTKRAEQLSPNQFIELTKRIYNA
ncbi:MAG: 16S rRNA (adenine(1518)-N(6)/adenine(1519)-N(6))-dimethyltransferase RsmA [Bacteroidales bacterium]|nr:16S rRNA (adenine(1518)-N(6)/adenine(1519)-N(6))-dimethyltransferase RsmA [Bacteroidales bacterium]